MKKILSLFLGFSFLIACGIPLVKNTTIYKISSPDIAEVYYGKMLNVLSELDWIIEKTDKPSLFIQAKKLTSGEAFSAVLGGEPGYHLVNINFISKDEEIVLNIQVSQPGKIVKYTTVCKKLMNEIVKKFEEKIK